MLGGDGRCANRSGWPLNQPSPASWELYTPIAAAVETESANSTMACFGGYGLIRSPHILGGVGLVVVKIMFHHQHHAFKSIYYGLELQAVPLNLTWVAFSADEGLNLPRFSGGSHP